MSSERALFLRARKILNGNRLGAFTKPSPRQYPHQWNWDSAFIAIGLARYDVRRAGREILSLLRGQWRDGMIPHIIYGQRDGYFPDRRRWKVPRSNYAHAQRHTSGITQPPMVTIAAHEISKSLGNDFARKVFQPLLAYHRWFYRERDPDRQGLVSIIHPWESGTDNSPRWIKVLEQIKMDPAPVYERKDRRFVSGEERPTDAEYDRFVYLMDLARDSRYDQDKILKKTPFVVQDVLLNSILYRSNDCLRKLAVSLREPTGEIDAWMNAAQAAFESRLWNESSGMHCDFDLHNNMPICENTIAIFSPLFAGLVDESRARTIVERHLLNPLEYAPDMPGTRYYLPTASKSSALFDSRRYWRGPIWVNTNWMVIRGLERYGYVELAGQIRRDTFILLERAGFYEYFDPNTGQGYGTNRFSWSAALAIDLLYDNPDSLLK